MFAVKGMHLFVRRHLGGDELCLSEDCLPRDNTVTREAIEQRWPLLQVEERNCSCRSTAESAVELGVCESNLSGYPWQDAE